MVRGTRDAYASTALRNEAHKRFKMAERLEAEYMRSLRMLAKQIDHIVKGMAPAGVVTDSHELQRVLRQYGIAIRPWATSVASKMVNRIAGVDESRWYSLSKQMGTALKKELQNAPTGKWLRQYLEENVELITSLPEDAARRVHDLTFGALSTGRRAEEIQKDILRTGDVTLSRARLIARTEVARTASGLVQSRMTNVGLTHYVWRTSMDETVRESHREMNGKIIEWAENNGKGHLLSDGTVCHAGQIWNCRCYPEPVLPDLSND